MLAEAGPLVAGQFNIKVTVKIQSLCGRPGVESEMSWRWDHVGKGREGYVGWAGLAGWVTVRRPKSKPGKGK